MAVSIEDVAKEAGVSISTVSRVLNRRDVVNPQTKQRVQQAIKRLGYRPNVFARGLMLRRSDILGLVLPDLHGEFYSEIIRGADLKTRELGYHMMLASVSSDDDGQDVLGAIGSKGFVDGVIVMVTEEDSRIRSSLQEVDLPIVVLDSIVEGVSHDAVLIDHSTGAGEMMDHLVSGRVGDRMVFIGGAETNLDTLERLKAFRAALESEGLPLREEDIVHLDYAYETALEYTLPRVREWAADRASVFAANDEMAAGVIDAAIDCGLKVPGDLRVAGFDDTRIAQLTRPSMSTVRVPMAEMGSAAVDLLVQRLREPERASVTLTLQSKLVVRESTASALKVDADAV